MIESYSNRFNRMRALRRTDLYSTFLLQSSLSHRLLLQAPDELHACLFRVHCQTTQSTVHNSLQLSNNTVDSRQHRRDQYFSSPWGSSPCSDEHPSPGHDVLHPGKWQLIINNHLQLRANTTLYHPCFVTWHPFLKVISVIRHQIIGQRWPGQAAVLRAPWYGRWC